MILVGRPGHIICRGLGNCSVEHPQNSTDCYCRVTLVCSPKPGPAGVLVSWNVKERRAVHEEVPVRAGAESLRLEAGGEWNTGGGSLPKDGHCRADLLPVEEEIGGRESRDVDTLTPYRTRHQSDAVIPVTNNIVTLLGPLAG